MLSQIEVRSTIRDCDGIDNWNFFPRKVPKPARVNTSKALCGSYPVNGSGASSYRSINTIRLPRPLAIYAFSPGKTWATIRVWSGAGSRASGFHQMGIETRQLVSFPLANRHESPFSETINPFSCFYAYRGPAIRRPLCARCRADDFSDLHCNLRSSYLFVNAWQYLLSIEVNRAPLVRLT